MVIGQPEKRIKERGGEEDTQGWTKGSRSCRVLHSRSCFIIHQQNYVHLPLSSQSSAAVLIHPVETRDRSGRVNIIKLLDYETRSQMQSTCQGTFMKQREQVLWSFSSVFEMYPYNIEVSKSDMSAKNPVINKVWNHQPGF